jgi:hypothetical protein
MKRRTFLGAASLGAIGASLSGVEARAVGDTAGTAVIREQPRDIPVVQTCDVCVLGGSCTGVFAAVRAAQLGARVALVEKQSAFGGVATMALVNMWHKLVSHKGEPIIGGLTKLMIDRLGEVGGVGKRGSGNFAINTQELKIELDRLVLQHEVTPYLHTFYASPLMDGNRVKAVFIENKNGRQAIVADVYVDATGDGELAKDVGLPFEIREGLQPPTTCAHVSGLPHGALGLALEHREEFGLAADHGWSAEVPGSNGVQMAAFLHVFNTNAADGAQLTAGEMEGRRKVRAYMDAARKYGGEKCSPCLLNLGGLGIRETRSFRANYALTGDDVLSCRRFPDAIANGTYPVDVHDPKTGKFHFTQVKGDFYQIPLSSLVSDEAPNVVLAGRSVSADRTAFGGIRVMVNLNQTGEAAGVTAATAAESKTAVAKVPADAVRKRLADLGAIVV